MGLTWRFSWLFSKIRRKNATVTKASAQSAFSEMNFDNSKIKNAFHFSFRDLDEMIEKQENKVERNKIGYKNNN